MASGGVGEGGEEREGGGEREGEEAGEEREGEEGEGVVELELRDLASASCLFVRGRDEMGGFGALAAGFLPEALAANFGAGFAIFAEGFATFGTIFGGFFAGDFAADLEGIAVGGFGVES